MQTAPTRRPLTRDEIAAIQAEYVAGDLKVDEIARRYDRTTATVYGYCQPLPKRQSRLDPAAIASIQNAYLAGQLPLREIAARHGVTMTTVVNYCAPLTKRQKQLVDPEMAVALAGEGVLQREIAALYGASAVAVCRAIKRYERRRRHG